MSESRKDRNVRIAKWAKKLTKAQQLALMVELVGELIDVGTVHFYSDALAPYWEGSGEPLVAGQKTYPDED